MIDPKELRIGNFLCGISDMYSDRADKIGENIFRVCVITDSLVSLDIGFEASQRYQNNPIWSPSLEELNPIPLTEEWLLKFGFGKVDDENKIANDKIVYGLFGIGFQLNLVVNHKWDAYTNWNNIRNFITANQAAVKYVHQLQNLYFALTGEELTLKIPIK